MIAQSINVEPGQGLLQLDSWIQEHTSNARLQVKQANERLFLCYNENEISYSGLTY